MHKIPSLGFSSEISTLPHFCFPFLTLLIQVYRNETYCLFEAALGAQQTLVLYPNCLSLDKPIFQYYENWGKNYSRLFFLISEKGFFFIDVTLFLITTDLRLKDRMFCLFIGMIIIYVWDFKFKEFFFFTIFW